MFELGSIKSTQRNKPWLSFPDVKPFRACPVSQIEGQGLSRQLAQLHPGLHLSLGFVQAKQICMFCALHSSLLGRVFCFLSRILSSHLQGKYFYSAAWSPQLSGRLLVTQLTSHSSFILSSVPQVSSVIEGQECPFATWSGKGQ